MITQKSDTEAIKAFVVDSQGETWLPDNNIRNFIHEMEDTLNDLPNILYDHLLFNRDKALAGLINDSMTDEQRHLLGQGVNAGVSAALATLAEQDVLLSCYSDGCEAAISAAILTDMFNEINN